MVKQPRLLCSSLRCQVTLSARKRDKCIERREKPRWDDPLWGKICPLQQITQSHEASRAAGSKLSPSWEGPQENMGHWLISDLSFDLFDFSRAIWSSLIDFFEAIHF